MDRSSTVIWQVIVKWKTHNTLESIALVLHIFGIIWIEKIEFMPFFISLFILRNEQVTKAISFQNRLNVFIYFTPSDKQWEKKWIQWLRRRRLFKLILYFFLNFRFINKTPVQIECPNAYETGARFLNEGTNNRERE